MALAARLRSNDDDLDVPQVADDPDYARAAAVLTAFVEHAEGLRQERRRLQLEGHFQNRPARDNSPADQGLLAQLIALRSLPPLSPTPTPAPASASPAILAGLAVLAGEPVVPKPGLQEQVQLVDRQLAVLSDACRAQQEIVDAIRDEVSARYAKQIKPRWDAIVLSMYRDAQQLARSTAEFRDLRAKIVRAGITGNSVVLRAPNVRTPLVLGSETDWGSEISTWRRLLESWGLLK